MKQQINFNGRLKVLKDEKKMECVFCGGKIEKKNGLFAKKRNQ
jgi:hypothetical protein